MTSDQKDSQNAYRQVGVKIGTPILLAEKVWQGAPTWRRAIVVEIKAEGDDFKIQLADAESGALIKSRVGTPGIWRLKMALANGTIRMRETDDTKLCPVCRRVLVDSIQTMCPVCRRNAKKQFFAEHVQMGDKPLLLDDEQADAVCADENALVTARAGSGKTRVLTAKLIDLVINQGVKEDELLAFCFNRNAAGEIRSRLWNECRVDGQPRLADLDVVHTFHAYAKGLAGETCDPILVDDSAPVRTQLIKQIINRFRRTDPTFERRLRTFFYAYTLRIDHKSFAKDEYYYRYVRNSRFRTLHGEHVKSLGEKYIADFLFEHGIRYKYERHFYLNKIDYKNFDRQKISEEDYWALLQGLKSETIPDFYLEDYECVWEHWGITGDEDEQKKIEFSNTVCDYDTYKRTMTWKRRFWKYWRYWLPAKQRYEHDYKSVKGFLETDRALFEGRTREEVEALLEAMLTAKGIPCKKRDQADILREVWEIAEDYFTVQIRMFVDRYQQRFLDDEEAFERLANQVGDERVHAFIEMGKAVYDEYRRVLAGQTDAYPEYRRYHMDFNLCLHTATQRIREGAYDDRIKPLKWLLIDEFQDFSALFYHLVEAIVARNPSVKLFCVGDDWQAINRFAGSDLTYYTHFERYFAPATRYNISTNYRSENHIVAKAGGFMQRAGIKGIPQRGYLEDAGVFAETPIDEARFEEDFASYDWLTTDKAFWGYAHDVNRQDVKAYMKICSTIINANPDKKILILNRRNTFLGKDLDEIKRILLNPRLCTIPAPQVDVKTVHQSKGEEADIVILTDVNENGFPIYNVDTNLYGIFGEDESTIMEDETRLYYVALTRAKHSVYVLFSKDRPSCFIS